MTDTLTRLVDEALKLPKEGRAALANQLLLSLEDGEADPEWSRAWAAEIERRSAALADGTATTSDWRTSIKQIRGSLREGKD